MSDAKSVITLTDTPDGSFPEGHSVGELRRPAIGHRPGQSTQYLFWSSGSRGDRLDMSMEVEREVLLELARTILATLDPPEPSTDEKILATLERIEARLSESGRR